MGKKAAVIAGMQSSRASARLRPGRAFGLSGNASLLSHASECCLRACRVTGVTCSTYLIMKPRRRPARIILMKVELS